MLSKKAKVAAIVVGLISLFCCIPHESTRIPGYSVRVVDGQGRPLQKVTVKQYVQDYSSGLDVDRSAEAQTDAEGDARFDRFVTRGSVMSDLLGCARQIVEAGAHASCGSYSDIAVSSNDLVETARSEQRVEGQSHQRSLKLTMKPCPSGD